MSMCNAQAPGSYLDFKVNPTITAIGPLSKISRSTSPDETTLNCDGVMDMLSVDFARALKDLAAVMNDLKRLATLGDLPISLINSTTLRVRFPGCDADLVESLCQELGVRRGLLHQDADFDAHGGVAMALLFPFASSKAPSEVTYSPKLPTTKREKRVPLAWQDMISPEGSPGLSRQSVTSQDLETFDVVEESPWLSDYSSLHDSEHNVEGMSPPRKRQRRGQSASDYEGLEGIYRFLEQCDSATR